MNGILIVGLFVGLSLSIIVLAFVIWGIKTEQFDDAQKQNSGLLFDTADDLNDAINKENKKKQLHKS
ncbi:MAG: cbb3-type cytochrome oxidase assembly protein CcoS [Epsilonproteobacteria bacterium]|nr:MAG: cbb3-type cytochrome oxidase assembly protein CcoS [Campylobacterota bacterium]